MRWLIAQRIQASQPLLERTSASIEEIAATVGFESAVTYRHHFSRMLSTSPSVYRRAFRLDEPMASPEPPAPRTGRQSRTVRARHVDEMAES
ncbi:helix-turn-helix domain-containing protein [Nonomuraea sp. NPDC048916]|uniref:helix-turn-helix domain-containing protein n=1 Tax=Nonomuraea sp. NPDC048916 TaxID=3154232 RepID=UPI0033FC1BBE